MKTLAIIAIVLAGINFSVAIGVIYSKHLSRQNYIELSKIQSSIDDLQIEWSKLQIEESTFSEHGTIETVANQRLDMTFPTVTTTVMISR